MIKSEVREVALAAIQTYCYYDSETSLDSGEAMGRAIEETVKDKWGQHPTIVCLCGSTRFWRTFQQAGLSETMAGRIVLSIGAASGTDDEHFGNLPRDEYDRVKEMLDQLHMRKIEMADEVLILNLHGYIGESTARELAHARKLGKVVRFLEKEAADAVVIADLRAANAALQSQLGQAHEALLLAQADAETLRAAVRHYTQADELEERLRGWDVLCQLGLAAHPGQALADEVAAARAENAYLREWIRSECSVADADINAAMAADVAKAARRKAKADADAEAETALLAAVAATDD